MRYRSRRYVKAIKEAINSLMGSRASVHVIIADYIGEYSHKPLIAEGDQLMRNNLQYFVIEQLLSSHYVKGFFCPYKLVYLGDTYHYEPNLDFRKNSQIKQVWDPLQKPHIRVRKHAYYLVPKKDESLHTHRIEAF